MEFKLSKDKRRSKAHAFFWIVLLSSFFYSIFEDFLPTSLTSKYGFYAACFLTGVYMLVSFKSTVSIYKLKYKKESSWVHYFFTLMAYAFTLCISWVLFAHTVPTLYTRLQGQSHIFNASAITTNKYERFACDYRSEGGVIESGFPRHLCISQSIYKSNSDQFRLSGYKSYLGGLITKVTPI